MNLLNPTGYMMHQQFNIQQLYALPALYFCFSTATVVARMLLNVMFIPTLLTLFHLNLLKPTGQVMHHQFNIQQLYALPALYLCVLYLSEKKQQLMPLTA